MQQRTRIDASSCGFVCDPCADFHGVRNGEPCDDFPAGAVCCACGDVLVPSVERLAALWEVGVTR